MVACEGSNPARLTSLAAHALHRLGWGILERMPRAATPSRLPRSRAPLALALGLFGFVTWAASPPPERSRLVEHLSRACSALDAGELDSAARDVRALLELSPELPEARLLESLLTLRRERPSLGGLDAFVQAWNRAGRPDFSDSRLLPPEFSVELPDVRAQGSLIRAGEAELMLALALYPDEERGRLILQHLRELDPPELIFAAEFVLDHESIPKQLRLQASKALRARLSELTVASPQAMQYPALLLVLDSSEEAPFTSEELQALDAIAALPDWRETDFHTLFNRALGHFQATGHEQPAHGAFSLAVSALATKPAYLLFKRTEASRDVLSAAQRQRLGEALWRIGSRMAAESTLLERILGGRTMVDGATLVGDEARVQQATAMSEEARAAANAMRQAVPERWPLRSLSTALIDAKVRDELGCMRRFLPPASTSPSSP